MPETITLMVEWRIREPQGHAAEEVWLLLADFKIFLNPGMVMRGVLILRYAGLYLHLDHKSRSQDSNEGYSLCWSHLISTMKET